MDTAAMSDDELKDALSGMSDGEKLDLLLRKVMDMEPVVQRMADREDFIAKLRAALIWTSVTMAALAAIITSFGPIAGLFRRDGSAD